MDRFHSILFSWGKLWYNINRIPIATARGTDGGISIMEGYAVHKTLLTSSDMQAILTGLRSLDSVSGTGRYAQLMEKLSVKNLRNGRYPCRICIRRQYISRITQQECFLLRNVNGDWLKNLEWKALRSCLTESFCLHSILQIWLSYIDGS